MGVGSRLAALRLFRRIVRAVRTTELGEPVVLADGIPLVLPAGHRHFRPLVKCFGCSREFPWMKERIRTATDFASIYWPDQPQRCSACATHRVAH